MARVLLAGNKTKSSSLCSLLDARGFSPLAIVEEEQGLLRAMSGIQPDIVIIDSSLKGKNLISLANTLQDGYHIPVLFIIPFGKKEVFDAATEMGFYPYIVYPIDGNSLATGINMTLLCFNEIKRLEEKVEDLKQKLDSRKIIEKAKGILMKKMKIDEEEAFRHLQKHSMNKRISMKGMAEAIILASEI